MLPLGMKSSVFHLTERRTLIILIKNTAFFIAFVTYVICD